MLVIAGGEAEATAFMAGIEETTGYPSENILDQIAPACSFFLDWKMRREC